jgi:hypothetical protein
MKDYAKSIRSLIFLYIKKPPIYQFLKIIVTGIIKQFQVCCFNFISISIHALQVHHPGFAGLNIGHLGNCKCIQELPKYSIFAAVSSEKKINNYKPGMGISPPTPILAKEVGRFVREKGRFVGRYEGFRHTLICMISI